MKNKKHLTPGIGELEMMLTMRNWMEDKGDEFHRYQTFEFIFSTVSELSLGLIQILELTLTVN